MEFNTIKDKLYKIYAENEIKRQTVNIFGVRKSDNNALNNMYEDVIGFDINGEILIFEGTTNPGKYYTVNPINKLGCAHVKEGFHPDIWQVGIHNPDTRNAHEAFIQTGNKITVIRDKNKNGIIDENEIEYVGFFGINLHGGALSEDDNINGWSAGCQVLRRRSELLNIVLPKIKSLPEFKNNSKMKFSYLLLNEKVLPEVFVF
jgi:hypothetical protein